MEQSSSTGIVNQILKMSHFKTAYVGASSDTHSNTYSQSMVKELQYSRMISYWWHPVYTMSVVMHTLVHAWQNVERLEFHVCIPNFTMWQIEIFTPVF